MPDVFKIYFRQCLIGFAIAAVFVTMLLVFNVQNLWTLISGSDVGLLAAFMLWFFNGIVFAGVQFGIHVMSMARDEDQDLNGPRNAIAEFAPVRVAAEKPRSVLHRRR